MRDAASEWGNCRVCGEPLTFEGGNVESGVEWGEAKCSNGHIWPAGRKDAPSAAWHHRATLPQLYLVLAWWWSCGFLTAWLVWGR